MPVSPTGSGTAGASSPNRTVVSSKKQLTLPEATRGPWRDLARILVCRDKFILGQIGQI